MVRNLKLTDSEPLKRSLGWNHERAAALQSYAERVRQGLSQPLVE
jgi:hypothetical protein